MASTTSEPTRAGATEAHPDEVRAVRRRVSADGLTRASGRRSLARAAVLLATAAPTTLLVLATGSWWAWLAHILVATAVLATLPSAYHEGAHRSLSRNKVVNDSAATAAALLHLVPFETWRYFHLAHHANAGTDDDSEVYPERWSRWTMLLFPPSQWMFVYLLWTWNISTVLGRGPRWIRTPRQVKMVRLNTLATLAGLTAVVALTVVEIRLLGLLVVPCALSIMAASLTLVPEHFPAYRIGPGDPDQLDRTNSFQSNPVVRLLMWNSNFHAAHHFSPKVPAHNLPRVNNLISGLQDEKWRWRGYWAWYRRWLPQLPWRLRADEPR